VGSSQADKAASHERIVKRASLRIRRDGVDSVSVAELMSEAGLTHGGFYRHFGSRDELVAEAIDAAVAPGRDRDEGHLIVAALVGGLVLARAVDDRGLSDEILDSVARALRGHVDDASQA